MVKSPEIKVSLECGKGVFLSVVASAFCLSAIVTFIRQFGLNAGMAGFAEGQGVGCSGTDLWVICVAFPSY
ncbi:hypothetical protein AGJ18_01230 [Cronobacter sakazakii]|nr:hypothetical protein [Cronobacter sakazakii]PQX89307.1 hypothetical protein C5940_19610 [Cronobacter sakazakii]